MKKKVLIADDDKGILESIQLLLEFEGYEVLTSNNGQTLKLIEEHLPEVVILDYMMPGMTGDEIAQYIKRNHKTKHIPVIMISANHNIKKVATKDIIDDFLPKPFDIDHLISKIQRYTS